MCPSGFAVLCLMVLICPQLSAIQGKMGQIVNHFRLFRSNGRIPKLLSSAGHHEAFHASENVMTPTLFTRSLKGINEALQEFHIEETVSFLSGSFCMNGHSFTYPWPYHPFFACMMF